MKPGYKTTEFWVTLASIIGPALLPGTQISPDIWMGTVAGLAAIYTGARAYTKGKK